MLSKADKTIKSNIPKLRFPEFKNSPAWQEKKLGAVATFLKGKGISKSDITVSGKQPCIRYGELYTLYNEIIKNANSHTDILVNNLVLSKANDVIIPASGETQGDIATASCVISNNIAIGGDLNIIRSKMNGIFLSYYLNNVKKNTIARLSQGISVVHLYSSQLKGLDINMPTLSEQQKIADCLTSLDDLITAQSQKVASLKQHKKGLMQQLFPTEGETKPKLRFKEFSGEWEEKKLEKVCNIFKGKQLNRDTLSNNDLYPVINGGINPSGYTNKSNKKSNTITISEGGNSCGYINFIKKDFWLGGHCYSLGNLKINQNFLYQLLKFNEVNIMRLRVGSGLPNIQKRILEDYLIKIVAEPKEQQKIADCLTSLDDLITTQSQKVANLKQHKKGLMQQLFPNNEVEK